MALLSRRHAAVVLLREAGRALLAVAVLVREVAANGHPVAVVEVAADRHVLHMALAVIAALVPAAVLVGPRVVPLAVAVLTALVGEGRPGCKHRGQDQRQQADGRNGFLHGRSGSVCSQRAASTIG
jgi:hypothetical protein